MSFPFRQPSGGDGDPPPQEQEAQNWNPPDYVIDKKPQAAAAKWEPPDYVLNKKKEKPKPTRPKGAELFYKAVEAAKDAWNKINTPVVDTTPQFKKAQESFIEQHPVLGRAGELGTSTVTSLTSPLTLGLT